MNQRLPLADRVRRAVRWLWLAAVLVLTPKCILCLLAYAGIGVALGLSGPELCGATGDTPGSWLAWLAALGLAAIAAGFFARRLSRRA